MAGTADNPSHSYRPTVLAIVLAGGAGSRLGPLTDGKAKPSLPFAGSYNLIDVPLSNLVHSGISDVWVVEQFQPHVLNEHVANGRPWDLDRTHGGLQLLPPFEGADGEGFAQGNADALARQLDLVRDFAPDLVLVLSADHLYRIDFRDVIDTHLNANAALTIVTTQVDGDVSRFSVVQSTDGVVTDFAYKPEEPASDVVCTEIFLYDAKVLVDELGALAEELDELEDYGDTLVPRLVENHRVADHRYTGYWRDMGTIESYWTAHAQMVAGEGFDVGGPVWPMYTAQPQDRPALIGPAATVSRSMLSPGCRVFGSVDQSVIGPGVTIEEGARVIGSVLLNGVTVARGARVERAIIDMDTQVGDDAVVGSDVDDDVSLEESITVVGASNSIDSGSRIEPGEQVPAAYS